MDQHEIDGYKLMDADTVYCVRGGAILELIDEIERLNAELVKRDGYLEG